MKTEKKKYIQMRDTYKKSNQIYKIQCPMTVNKKAFNSYQTFKNSCIQSKKVHDNNNTFKIHYYSFVSK